jgi:hypothetical protein
MKPNYLLFPLFLLCWSAPGLSMPLDLLPAPKQKTERFSRFFSKKKRAKRQKRPRVQQGCDTLMLANGVRMLITDAKEKGPYLRFKDCEDPNKKFILHQRELSAIRYQDGTIHQFTFRERELAQRQQSQNLLLHCLIVYSGDIVCRDGSDHGDLCCF